MTLYTLQNALLVWGPDLVPCTTRNDAIDGKRSRAEMFLLDKTTILSISVVMTMMLMSSDWS